VRSHQDRSQRLGEVLRGLLRDEQALEVTVEHMVPAVWASVVGPWYARHTAVARVWEGIVDVACDSSARAQQLQLDSTEVIRRLNLRLGQPYVRQIRPSTAGRAILRRQQVARGNRGYISPAPTAAELEAVPLPPVDEAWLAEQAAKVPEGKTRDAFATSLRIHLKLRQWRLEHGWVACRTCGELHDGREGCTYCRTGETG
jgi:predicted nucleic acid-binding Zn ribbon protein